MSSVIDEIIQYNYNELKEIYDHDSTTIIIDVREEEEYEEAHIPRIPLLPMSEIVDVIDDFAKDKKYVLVCRSGRRSQEVALFFKDNGIDEVANYADGMLGWQGEIASGLEHVITDVKLLYKK
ncbi:rhodanese-like domain-containing protein [Bacillaceae bacterium IKA-2]|jgi:rhodanese-related sulfurtransferase|nr:rhodanese-like domain-containing protein [Bacillaceae bacterium IKA-2]